MKESPRLSTPGEKRTFFTALLCGPRADEKISALAAAGKLEELFPEVNAMIGVTQPPEFHPEGDVFEHTMLMLRHMAYPDPQLGWSVLLHDVGKPLTRSVETSGRIRFFGHEERGAELAERILTEDFAFSPSEAAPIVNAVRNHMRFAHVKDMRRTKLERLMKEPFFGLELELHRLDCISCHCKMECFDFLLGQYLQMPPEEPERLLSGRDLKERGIEPGVALGNMLRAVEKAQQTGVISTREEALKYVDNLISERMK